MLLLVIPLALAGCHRNAASEKRTQTPIRLTRRVPVQIPGHPYIPPAEASRTNEIQLADSLRRRLGAHPIALMPKNNFQAGRAGEMRRPIYAREGHDR